MNILIVEDEPNIASFEKLELEHEGYAVTLAQTGREALAFFEENLKGDPQNFFSIVLLDIMLPELNGIEVLRRIRKLSQVPVILVTARGETFDKVNGLDAGADDYIAKPFAIEELLARIRSVLRRSAQQETAQNTEQSTNAEQSVIIFDRLKLNAASYEVFVDDTLITLTKTEFLLLKCLLCHQGEVLSRTDIINEVWGEDHYIDENSVDVYVRYLRTKIDEVFNVSYITTVRGAGYTIRKPSNA
ncbi:MAG: response regulator transcription factor [Treponemataceae bacterium]|nr:response regulator transcription factor [Treponemataceae bacterium]